MPTRASEQVGSPRPDEPDLHLRIRYADRNFDYAACRTAATNFLEGWQRSHHPAVSAEVVRDDWAQLTRLPCEDLWLTP
ncbi:hypothetical protein CRH09_15555 [Nocardia terpenica]|uniref:Uncharacterized protein n=1 Tax=Nocardia terpenica TaxID=455432 RepID=A0A291RII0_9NOCA|nr:hypothetical protein CRH09_15555 [Nocardia terpenica]